MGLENLLIINNSIQCPTDKMDGESVELVVGSHQVDPTPPAVMKTAEQNNNNINKSQLNIKVVSWNLRSVNSFEKIKLLMDNPNDILLLQEIWHPQESYLKLFPDSRSIMTRPKDQDGGGTLIVWREGLLTPIGEEVKINDDSFIKKFSIVGNRIIWISSIYLNRGNKTTFMDTITKIQHAVPKNEWPYMILCGDWNINLKEETNRSEESNKENKLKVMIEAVAKQMGLKITHGGCSRENNIIDYMLIGAEIKIKEPMLIEPMNLSDHRLLSFEMTTEQPKKSLRTIYVPNKKLAQSFTINSLKEAENAHSFLKATQRRMKSIGNDIRKKIKRKEHKRELLQRIMEMSDDDDIREIISHYWKEKYEENQELRLSGDSKSSFEFLNKVMKYHDNRRDGSIISEIVDEKGTTISNEDEVNKILIQELQKIQVKEDQPKYELPTPFPILPLPSEHEMEYMLSNLTSDKALSFDGITDSIFKKEYREEVKEKFKTLWNDFATHDDIDELHFDARLIPLNKVHPQVPTSQQCRPIVVSSPIVKLLEIRLKEKLERYSIKKLTSCQTGFVPLNGITVNHFRLSSRISLRTNQTEDKKKVFGLFIDFSTAYNTVLHTKLYQRLEKVLNSEEINLIKAIYSRNRVKLGNYSFSPNIGVAQGSVISPFLFNIYVEEMYERINKECDVNLEDMLGYADDTLILCSSIHQLRKVIQIIKSWSDENNLKLNAKKSGIMEFRTKFERKGSILKVGSELEGIPIVDTYKYLGTWINKDLSLDCQYDYLENKFNYMYYKLWPLLKQSDLIYRIDLWNVLVKPHFELCASLYHYSNNSIKENFITFTKKTFKKFCMLKKNVNNEVLRRLMNYDFEDRSQIIIQIAALKWEARKRRTRPELQDVKKKEEVKNNKIPFPKELQEFLNMQLAICPLCHIPCNWNHMLKIHGRYIPDNETLFRKMEEITTESMNEKIKKKDIIKRIANYIKPFNLCYVEFLSIKRSQGK